MRLGIRVSKRFPGMMKPILMQPKSEHYKRNVLRYAMQDFLLYKLQWCSVEVDGFKWVWSRKQAV